MICIHRVSSKMMNLSLFSSADLFQRKAQPFSIELAEKDENSLSWQRIVGKKSSDRA